MRESHLTRTWSYRAAPAALAGEITCPEICLDIGVMGSDDKGERAEAPNTYYNIQIRSEDAETKFI